MHPYISAPSKVIDVILMPQLLIFDLIHLKVYCSLYSIKEDSGKLVRQRSNFIILLFQYFVSCQEMYLVVFGSNCFQLSLQLICRVI